MDFASEQRLAKNEAIFKNMNNHIKEASKRLFSQADTDDFPVRFYCECSDEHCRERVALTSDQYQQIHSNNRRFVVRRGHENPEIETEVERYGNYVILEKFEPPPAVTDDTLPLTS